MRATRPFGFTLIELMIVVAVVAILAIIALPMYSEHVRKGKRAESMQAPGDLQLREESYRADNPTYGTMDQLTGSAANTAAYNTALKYYNVAISGPGTGGVPNGVDYVITATRKGDLLNDPKCANFIVRFGSTCANADAPGTINKCMSDNANVDYCWRR